MPHQHLLILVVISVCLIYINDFVNRLLAPEVEHLINLNILALSAMDSMNSVDANSVPIQSISHSAFNNSTDITCKEMKQICKILLDMKQFFRIRMYWIHPLVEMM